MYAFIEDKEPQILKNSARLSEKEKRKFIIKTVEDAVKTFDLIGEALSRINHEFSEIGLIFFNTDWGFKESINNSLSEFFKHIESIRFHLTKLDMMNTSLNNFLANDKRPIPVAESNLRYIDLEVEFVAKHIKLYYKTVEGTLFPKLDDDVKRCKSIIERINKNIDRVNIINAAYSMPKLKPIRKLST